VLCQDGHLPLAGIDQTPAPLQHDVMLKITATAICGSDLHLYLNAMPGVHCNVKTSTLQGVEFTLVCFEALICVLHAKIRSCSIAFRSLASVAQQFRLNFGIVGMKKGDVLGHEFMGVVEEVGSEVTKFKKGDRAVASFELGCGQCIFCKHDQFSSCDTTNPR